MDPKLF